MKLVDVVKIRKADQRLLVEAGIHTITDLIDADVADLADVTGIDADILADWQRAAAEAAFAKLEAAQAADVAPGGDVGGPGEPVIYLLTGVKRG